MNKAIKWYDRFSKIYDFMNDYPYQPVRQRAISVLGIEAGDTVFDLFCGTGVNFGQILTQMGGSGTIIGIDGSPGMLLQARRRIQQNNWDENRINLYEKDLFSASVGFFSERLPNGCIPKVLITLGPAGLPDWETFWDNLYTAMPIDTRFVTMDVYCRKGTLSAGIINLFGAGDYRVDVSSHKAWEHLKSRCADYREETYHPFKLLRCSVVVASGVKGSTVRAQNNSRLSERLRYSNNNGLQRTASLRSAAAEADRSAPLDTEENE